MDGAQTLDSLTETLQSVLDGTGLFVRGAFRPAPEDAVAPLPDGRAAETVILIGNAGPDLWRAFLADDDAKDGNHPLDRWVDRHIEDAAQAIGAHPIFPTRRPWPPIQRWAEKADTVFPSPLGLRIHPDYGLWHVYRGALCLADRVALPETGPARAHPCETCRAKPCLSVCPVDAFRPEGFDMDGCVDHVEGEDRGKCQRFGCLARRACPVGREYRYPEDEGAYHMKAVIETVRGFQRGRGV